VDICMLLIEKNALIEDKSLINAALNGHETVCRLLIEKNATVHGKNGFGWTPLLAAAFHGHEAISKLLIEKNAAIAAKAINGFTPLINAALNNHEGTCRLLIDTQLERARKKAGIKTFLGITRKRKTHLPCEMQWDIAIMIVRQALETIKQDKQSVIDQINGLNEQKKPKWLDYANQQINSPIK
jgi:ankyrin repeat protein